MHVKHFVVVLALLLGSRWVVSQEKDGPSEQELRTLSANLITLARPMRQYSGRNQFGGLFLYEWNMNTGPQFQPHPTDSDGKLIFSDSKRYSPPNLNLLRNYLVAAPVGTGEKEDKPPFIHVEEFVLVNQWANLKNAYATNYGRMPAHAVLYTYLSPCTKICTNAIVNFANNNKAALQLTLAYSKDYGAASAVKQNLELIRKAGVEVLHMPADTTCKRQRRSAETDVCPVLMLQACLLDRLDELCCFQNQSDKAPFINTLAAQCFPDFTQTCSDSVLEEWRMSECGSPLSTLRSNLYNIVEACSPNTLSHPLVVAEPARLTGELICPNCLQPPPVSCGVKQQAACGRREQQCTTTAGNDLCRADHYCGLHGQSYSWCYVDSQGGWDYCCLGTCRMDSSQDALMCYAGQDNKSSSDTEIHRFCGDAGIYTVKGKACRSTHSCGTHNGTDYYWCYTDPSPDGTGWDYCCRPDQICSKNGESYDWCFVGRDLTKMACNSSREATCKARASCPCNETANCSQAASSADRVAVFWGVAQVLAVAVSAAFAVHMSGLHLALYVPQQANPGGHHTDPHY